MRGKYITPSLKLAVLSKGNSTRKNFAVEERKAAIENYTPVWGKEVLTGTAQIQWIGPRLFATAS